MENEMKTCATDSEVGQEQRGVTYCPSGSTAAGPLPLSTPVIVYDMYEDEEWLRGRMYKYNKRISMIRA